MLDHIVALRTEIDARVASHHVRLLLCADVTLPHSDLGRAIPPAQYIRLVNSPSLFRSLVTRRLYSIVMAYNLVSWVTKDGLLPVLYKANDVYRLVSSPSLLQRIAYHTLRTATYPFDALF